MTDRPPERQARSIGCAVATVQHRLEHNADGATIEGRVLDTFPGGMYVRFGSTVFAIGERLHPGPLHLVIVGPLPVVAGGATVTMTSDAIGLGPVRIRLDAGRRWRPAPPEELDAALSTLVLAARTPPIVIDELGAVWDDVTAAAHEADLDRARRLLQGRGPGLTPVGDDVLAGLLLVHTFAGNRSTRAVADTAETTDLSAAFLHWAARGQTIAPVHHMIDRAARYRTEEALQAAAIVRSIGSSSGPALMAGIGLAASALSAR